VGGAAIALGARTYQDLAAAVIETKEQLTGSDLRGWYNHVRRLERVAQNE
jgi:hypothetical protein